jgi:hypothetical protein
VRGERFALGDGLSPEAADRLGRAKAFLDRLIAAPEASAWRRLAADPCGADAAARPCATSER